MAFVVLDASEGITAQDTHLAGYVREARKGLVLVANKWDLVVPRTPTSQQEFAERIRSEFRFIPYAPIHFTSAKTGTRRRRPAGPRPEDPRREAAASADGQAERGRSGDDRRALPAKREGAPLRIYYATQAGTNPPTFVFFVNDPKLLHFGYERYLENRLRATFGFEGTPVRLVFRPRSEDERPGGGGKR